ARRPGGTSPATVDGRPSSERIAPGWQAAYRPTQETPPQRMDAGPDEYPLYQDPRLRPGQGAQHHAAVVAVDVHHLVHGPEHRRHAVGNRPGGDAFRDVPR